MVDRGGRMKPISLGNDEEYMTESAIHGKPVMQTYYPLRRTGSDVAVTQLLLDLMGRLEFVTWQLGKAFREQLLTIESLNIGMSSVEWGEVWRP